MKNRLINRSQQGFTIIELLIATAVLSLILLLVTTMMINIGNLFLKGVNESRVQDAVRGITDEISQELQLSPTSALQSGVDPTTGVDNVPVNVYCVGNTRYSYVQDVQIGAKRLDGAGNPTGPLYSDVLWRDIPAGGCNPNVAADLTSTSLAQQDATAGATNTAELMPPDSRLTEFCIGTIDSATGACDYATGSPYTISVSIAYGDDDLLCDNGYTNAGVGDCSHSGVSPHMIQVIANSTATPVVNVIPPDQIICKGTKGDQFCGTASLSTTVANRL